MTDKRKIEIINMILEWFEKNSYKFRIDCDLRNGGAQGICAITASYLNLETIESRKFNHYMMSGTKHRWKYSAERYKGVYYNTYLFKPGNIKPRVNYLNRLKKSLS